MWVIKVVILISLIGVGFAENCPEEATCRYCVQSRNCFYYLTGATSGFCGEGGILPQVYLFKIGRLSSCTSLDTHFHASPNHALIDLTKKPFVDKGNSAVGDVMKTITNTTHVIVTGHDVDLYVDQNNEKTSLQSLPTPLAVKNKKVDMKRTPTQLTESVCKQFSVVYEQVHPGKRSQYVRCIRKLTY